jgi:hypothetical protein
MREATQRRPQLTLAPVLRSPSPTSPASSAGSRFSCLPSEDEDMEEVEVMARDVTTRAACCVLDRQ